MKKQKLITVINEHDVLRLQLGMIKGGKLSKNTCKKGLTNDTNSTECLKGKIQGNGDLECKTGKLKNNKLQAL